ncbi:MAG: hypothetical protein M0Z33_00850 [Actinomycetota bacterium]|nr:hypothetical protein [Actinomycetota bacterium]
MKRNAQATIRLAKALVKQGRPASTRRLERWSHDGLGPIGTPDFSILVHHYAEVASLSTVGRDADMVARRLASRGYTCERLRGAILRELGISPEPPALVPPMTDLSSSPTGDAGFAAIEQLARDLMSDARGVPPLMVKVVRALYRNATQRAEQLGEPADAIFHSFVVNGLVHLMGGDYYNGEAMEAVLGFDRGTISLEALEVMNSELRISMPALDNAYRTVPLDEIAFMAHRLATWAPLVLSYLQVTGTQPAEIEDLAVVFAPAAIHYVSLLREAFDDFPDEPLPLTPPTLELPAAASE